MTQNEGPLKVFVSYSHKDEDYLNDFKKYIVTLERKKLLNIWSDKELVGGDHLDSEIENYLAESDLVVFLVSQDFIASLYCYEGEMMKALNRLDNGEIRIIPIVVRTCKWKDTPLKAYLSATKNGVPISQYSDRDGAWVEVMESLENSAKKYINTKSNMTPGSLAIDNKQIILNQEFIKYLNDTEVSFQSKYKEEIVLDDIYVYPDLKNLKQEYDDIEATTNSFQLTKLDSSTEKLLILGSEQSGKTSICKMIFKAYFEKGYLPLFCCGRDIKSADVNKIINKLVNAQYSNFSFDNYLSSDRLKILIIDDFDKLSINTRYQTKCLSNVSKIVDNLIIIADSAIKYDEHQLLEFSDYHHYEIKSFGHLRRGELIEKWNSIGRVETVDITELHNQTDYIAHHVDAIIRKNILPRKPVYILTIIQLFDTSQSSDYSLTSYGHCYQSLIQTMLKKTNIKVNDFDLYANYLSELSYFIFVAGEDKLSDALFKNFKTDYSDKYLINSHDDVMEHLISSGILRQTHNSIYFGHRYIYYFYVSKYLSDNIDSAECKKNIERICEKIHVEKNANILIFLVHHTKDQGVIDEILLQASVVYDGSKESNLGVDDTKYLLDYIASIPKLVLEQRNIEKERKQRLKSRDDFDENDDREEGEEDPDREMLAEINRSFRIVEIIGQILRNRHGSLTKSQLKDLCVAAYSSGLKFLNYFLTMTRKDQEHILAFIQEIFKENTKLSDDKISKEARNIFLMLCYGTSYSVLKKIADSVGSDKLIPLFQELCDENKESPAFKLIFIAIQLEFSKCIPKNLIEKTYIELDKNPIAQRLLQEIVIQHLYLNHIEFKERQWISDILKLPMTTQRRIQQKKEQKQ